MLSAATLQAATLYAQPGGMGELSQAYQHVKRHAQEITSFVASGGRYLGICMGGYLAGRTPGFQLLPGDTDQWMASRRASVRTEAETIVNVYWRGQLRSMYFQDGPYFRLDRGATGVMVLATYTNGKIAALVAPYGSMKTFITLRASPVAVRARTGADRPGYLRTVTLLA